MKIRILIGLLLLSVSACQWFKTQDERVAVARVNDTYLYQDDINNLVPENMSKEDSTLIVQNFINRWATQELLVEGAKRNLQESKLKDFQQLVNQYKKDLYSKAYLEALVKQSIDTTVSLSEAEEYYKANGEAFKLNEDLIKFRYINLDENRLDFKELKTKFERFNAADRRELDSISIQFKSYALNDTVWIRARQVLNKLPVVSVENKDQLLKKSNFIQLKDSLGVYLMRVNDVLLRGSKAPLEYVKPTIDQIVINKRKLELIRDLEKDITKDAIKNKQFEIYN
ncbi:peptidyl-prolyl cis-trans isomerase [Formosa sediminum]|uniref:Peptidyl-prolyl cis-trans isomerase n=1 Tax=Formosa sediminum TaxID=2594004 RepID=A0A516GS04_9FLAO|nr:peptidyl-prolyl cis-trans isomerase [Formosa sediminum]QDO94150.1 peptidyl-prolyl cis-trans isomerase [Formosa sediminum]